jgi:hypothetical protein
MDQSLVVQLVERPMTDPYSLAHLVKMTIYSYYLVEGAM